MQAVLFTGTESKHTGAIMLEQSGGEYVRLSI